MEEEERAIRLWVEAALRKRLAGSTLHEALCSGAALCALLNSLRPGLCAPPSSSRVENVRAYLHGCRRLAIEEDELFSPADLIEGRNMHRVLANIKAVARTAAQLETFAGPTLQLEDGFGQHASLDEKVGPYDTLEELFTRLTAGGLFLVDQRAASLLFSSAEAEQSRHVRLPEALRASALKSGKPTGGRSSRASFEAPKLSWENAERHREDLVRKFIESALGERIGQCSLQHELKDGVVLCNLMNAIRPGSCILPSTSNIPSKRLENVKAYLRCCQEMGIPMFAPPDVLDETRDFDLVVNNLEALARIANIKMQRDYKAARMSRGPRLSVKSEEKIRALAEAQAAKPFHERGGTVGLDAQADSTLHAPAAWRARMRLRQHPLVIKQLAEWWKLISANGKKKELSKQDYIDLQVVLHKVLREPRHYKPSEAVECANEEWATDSKGSQTMKREQFMDAMFELCDLWTFSVEAEEYASFLGAVLQRVTRENADGTIGLKAVENVRFLHPRNWTTHEAGSSLAHEADQSRGIRAQGEKPARKWEEQRTADPLGQGACVSKLKPSTPTLQSSPITSSTSTRPAADARRVAPEKHIVKREPARQKTAYSTATAAGGVAQLGARPASGMARAMQCTQMASQAQPAPLYRRRSSETVPRNNRGEGLTYSVASSCVRGPVMTSEPRVRPTSRPARRPTHWEFQFRESPVQPHHSASTKPGSPALPLTANGIPLSSSSPYLTQSGPRQPRVMSAEKILQPSRATARPQKLSDIINECDLARLPRTCSGAPPSPNLSVDTRGLSHNRPPSQGFHRF
ncbi:hypothetical protein AB1Y20_022837 [Prymnesium parvum]|uniref:Calponin-homology (CH) domain-containing protein n=1 Tax=Prymnesium parvum TaxID=97485 RepID=A0AB34JEJ6_PRYPA